MPSMLRGYAAAIVAACLFYSRPQQPETREAPAPLCLQDISPVEAFDFKRKAVQRRLRFPAARSPVKDWFLSAQVRRVCTSGGISTDAISVAFTVDQTGMP